MKKMRYLLLLILFIPVIALAEPIHLTQAVIEEAFANRNIEINDYKIKFVFDSYSTGFVLTGEEYTLDEDIDLHQGFMTPATSQLVVVNLNGHNINQNLEVYSGKDYTCIIRDLWDTTAIVNMTINGPGTLGTAGPIYGNNVNIHGGTVTFNNVDVKGSVRASSNNAPGILNFNNSRLEGRFEMWGATINIDGGSYNYSESGSYNMLEGANANINNATITVKSGDGLDVFENNGVPSKAKISNTTISGGNNVFWVTGDSELTIENSELIGAQQNGWYGIYTSSSAKVQLADVHIFIDRELTGVKAIQIVDTPNDNAEEQLNKLLKEGYIYWKDPEYFNYYSSSDDMNNAILYNKEIWIIKQQEEYEAEEQTYVIPEDNEIIIKVSGYKVLLEDIMINGEVVPNTNYELLDSDDNEVIIKLSSDYLKTLEANKYDIEVVFANGSATTTLNVVDEEPVSNLMPVSNEVPEVKGEVENPKTGVHNHLILLIPIVVLGIVYLYTSKKTLFKI